MSRKRFADSTIDDGEFAVKPSQVKGIKGDHMKRYQLPQQEKTALERLRQPFAIYQFVDKRVVTLLLSDGFCKLFGYDDRAQAYWAYL